LRTHELFRVIIVYVATYGLMTSLDVRYLPQLTSVFAMSAFRGKADIETGGQNVGLQSNRFFSVCPK